MNTRLKQFLAAENITQAQFADSINVVRASVSHILSGRNNPSFDFIKAMMARYPNLNMEWLMFGKDRMYKDSPAPTAAAPEYDILFPEEEQETPTRIPEIVQEPEKIGPEAPLKEIKTLDNIVQHTVNQRKVSKIIILFDDGTYQEL